MHDNSQETAQLVESGQYFERARAWYRAIYVAPISERAFFLLVATLASAVALVGFTAVLGLLPLTERPAVLVAAVDVDETVPSLSRVKEKGQPLPQALMHFFIESYVRAREGYAAGDYARNYNFIRAQSDDLAFQAYLATYDKANPQSPAAILGSSAQRLVRVHSITVDESKDPKIANVAFSTEIEGRDLPSRTNWTATLQFVYTDLVMAESVDPKTGETQQITEDPQFKVVDYVLTKAL
jgi:type IV secretory pathway component VirB8